MSRDVYAPSEDTALLLAALRAEGSLAGLRALDVGTGSGVVAAAMEELGADLVVAVDISPLAARMARQRVARVVRADLTSALRGPFDVVEGDVAANVAPSTGRSRWRGFDVVEGDVAANVAPSTGRSRWRGFDVIAFNAPYLPSSDEERVEGWLDRAFHGGEGGVEVSEAFVRDLPRVLAQGGRAYLVVSSRADLERLARAISIAGLRHEKVASERFFFEEIAVWRIVSR